MDGDLNHFTRRADEERTAAMRAEHPQARRSHQDLAARYEHLASTISKGEHFAGMRSPRVA
jgi:hypothetical protein